MNSKIIAVDFDGTLCENKWPEIGEANEDMIYYLRKRQAEGDKLILWTCRVGDMLRKAINWCCLTDRGSTFTHIKHVREKGGKVFSCKGFEKRMKYFMYIDGKEGSTK